jgi:WD40 repeat protein
MPAHGAAPGILSLSPDGRRATRVVVDRSRTCTNFGVLCKLPSTVRVVRLASGATVASYPGATTAAFDPSGRWLALGQPGKLRIADTRDSHTGRTIALPAFDPLQIVWTPDGNSLLVRGQDTDFTPIVMSVDRATGARRRITPDREGTAVAISPDGHTIATGGPSGTVKLWARSGATISTTPLSSVAADVSPISGLTFSPDGARLATSGQTAAALWDLRDRTLPRRLDVLTDLAALARLREHWTAPEVGLSAEGARWGLVAFRPDGRSLMLAGPTGVVELADFDPALACSLASAADLAAAKRTLGSPSACTRVDELRRAAAARRHRTSDN